MHIGVQAQHPLFGNVGRIPRHEPRETRAGSSAGRHVGGEDVVRVAVQVAAGPVVPHRGSRVSVAGGGLHVAQVGASVEHGRDVSVTEHVGVCPGDLDAGGFGQPVQAAGGRVPVHHIPTLGQRIRRPAPHPTRRSQRQKRASVAGHLQVYEGTGRALYCRFRAAT
jgi:hypothetical protein